VRGTLDGLLSNGFFHHNVSPSKKGYRGGFKKKEHQPLSKKRSEEITREKATLKKNWVGESKNIGGWTKEGVRTGMAWTALQPPRKQKHGGEKTLKIP